MPWLERISTKLEFESSLSQLEREMIDRYKMDISFWAEKQSSWFVKTCFFLYMMRFQRCVIQHFWLSPTQIILYQEIIIASALQPNIPPFWNTYSASNSTITVQKNCEEKQGNHSRCCFTFHHLTSPEQSTAIHCLKQLEKIQKQKYSVETCGKRSTSTHQCIYACYSKLVSR